ncbi:hypothetical protein WA026_017924 [Henosepilachna vigintioctopunctata]|uniref:Carboxylesterase type B domain-containing protein n=1 Tax=Henosepilachna vigintioctopunctata TaxID=420089 RepID=A0AAW1TQ45_9CUCU
MIEASDKLILFLILGCHIVHSVPRAHLKQGVVQGTNRKSYDGRTFSAFEGIPYAKPPVGELRFREPVAAPCWNNVLIANKSYMCSQLDGTLTVIGTEDCLYLNVYVPKNNIDENDTFDVLVHIHGGSLSIGSASTMSLPDYLMDKDLILVAFNYRLGAAGFLSTGDSVMPGNNGLKDQTWL